MKKRLIILLTLIMIFSLTACGTKKDNTVEKDIEIGEVEKNKEELKIPATIDKFKTEVEINEPDSIGTIWGKMTVTNNSEYPLLSFEAVGVRKDNNENTYFSTYDTVMPGEKSPVFETIISEDINNQEYEINNYQYAIKKDDKKIVIEYDVKLEEYNIFEVEN